MKKTMFVLFLCILALCTCATALADETLDRIISEGVIKIGTSADYPPITSLDETKEGNDQYIGSEMAFARFLAAELGVEVQFEKYGFDDLFDFALEGLVDLGMAGFEYVETRAKSGICSDPYRLSDEYDMAIIMSPDAPDLRARINEIIKKANDLGLFERWMAGKTFEGTSQNSAGDSVAEELFQKGLAFFNAEDYEAAVPLFTQAAEAEHAQAQYYLGKCYEEGWGIEKNYEEAEKWYRLSAEQACDMGQNALGWCYEEGIGVEQNYDEAVKWYRLAVAQGNVKAQVNLGYCYESGNGVEQNYQEAAKWYLLAAEQGNVNAQVNLGWYYENGVGVEKSIEEAIKWYRLAAEQGDEYAIEALKSLE